MLTGDSPYKPKYYMVSNVYNKEHSSRDNLLYGELLLKTINKHANIKMSLKTRTKNYYAWER